MSARARIHAMFPLDEAATAELDARLDAVRTEAFTEAAEALDAIASDMRDKTGWPDRYASPDAVAAVRAAAREMGWLATVPSGKKVTAPAATADFFRPGHTYATSQGFRFECHAVAPTPWDGTPSAIGYLTHPDGSEHVHGMTAEQWADGDWDDTTNTTTGGSHV